MLLRALATVSNAVWWAFSIRSPAWPHVRAAHLRHEPECQWCGGMDDLECHHIVPYHIDRTKELSPENLISLCMFPGRECHYMRGHLGRSWMVYDPDIRQKCREHRLAREACDE